MVFENLAKISNGQVYVINVENIATIFQHLATKSDDSHILLQSAHLSKSQRLEVPVDSTLSQIDIIVSGQNSSVLFFIPEHAVPQNVTNSISLINVDTYDIESPAAGVWNIKNINETPVSVQIRAKTNVTFTYGFSINSPNSMSETSPLPSSGEIFVVYFYYKKRSRR